MIAANARQRAIAQATLLKREGEWNIPDSPFVVEDCTFAGGMEDKADRMRAPTEVKFAVLRSIVTFLILVQIHWAGGGAFPLPCGGGLIILRGRPRPAPGRDGGLARG